jgi:hypothetical protein
VSHDSDVGARPPDPRSRVIHLDAGQLRDPGANCKTIIAIGDSLSVERVPFEALFLAHYRSIRELGRGAGDAGIAIVAVHARTCALAARAWVAARPGKIASAIIGRHSEVDVLLDGPTLSLRHLALLVSPLSSWDAPSYEVLDLRTQAPFRDERGRPLEGLSTEGPALLSCGPFALFFLPTGDPADWPELAPDAWAMLPERVFARESAAEPDRWRRGAYGRRSVKRRERQQTCITEIPSVLSAGEPLVLDGEAPIGTLRITGEHGSRNLAVGSFAAQRGVLLGRYERCDGSDILQNEHVSRAHLLVKRLGDRLVGIDTASTEGTYVDGQEHAARVVALDRGEVAVLGDGRAFVRWLPSA